VFDVFSLQSCLQSIHFVSIPNLCIYRHNLCRINVTFTHIPAFITNDSSRARDISIASAHKSNNTELITIDWSCRTYYADRGRNENCDKFDEIRLTLIDYSFKTLADIMKDNFPVAIASSPAR